MQAAMNQDFLRKLSRMYDGPLANSLTGVVLLVLSIVITVNA